MKHDGKRLRPVVDPEESDYPSYPEYQAERRAVLRWLGAGGTLAITSGLLGCDSVRDLLGISRPGGQLAGEIACPTPPPPPPPTGAAGEGDGTEPEAAGAGTEATAVPDPELEARPPAALRGDIAMPEPVEEPEPARPGKKAGKVRAVNPNEPKE